MIWPLGKKFDLWVRADSSRILELLEDRESIYGQRPIIFFDNPGIYLGKYVTIPYIQRFELARQMWARIEPWGEGARITGLYGYCLSLQYALFITFSLFTLIFLLVPTDPEWVEFGSFALGIFLFDRITRPFAKTVYDDFITFLQIVSEDGEVLAVEDAPGRDACEKGT